MKNSISTATASLKRPVSYGDDEDRVLYAFSPAMFRCETAGTVAADLLVAVNGADNRRNRPVGSGFWVADLKKDDCGVESQTLWGCRFDGGGEATECGAATIDTKNGELMILAATQ